MGSRKFTLIELHLDGEAQFGPRSIGETLPILGSGVEADVDEETERDAETDEDAGAAADDSGGKPIAAIVGLVALVAIAVAVKKFRGGDEDGFEAREDRDEPDVIVN